jgi:spore germination protein KC
LSTFCYFRRSGRQFSPTSNINSENIISNSSPVSGDSKAENIGLAVFKDDVLVGELNSIETLCSLIIGNKVSGFLVSVPNPSKSNSYLDIYITPLNETKFKVDIINGTPYISVKCRFTGRIYSMEENSKYLDDKLLKEISDSCNSYIKSVMTDYLYKTSKYLKSDINSFGKAAQSKFLTTKDFNNYNWNEKYKDSFFDVEIDSSIRSSFLITES